MPIYNLTLTLTLTLTIFRNYVFSQFTNTNTKTSTLTHRRKKMHTYQSSTTSVYPSQPIRYRLQFRLAPHQHLYDRHGIAFYAPSTPSVQFCTTKVTPVM